MFVFSTQSFGYDCKSTSLKAKVSSEKKDAYQAFGKMNRQTLVEAMLFEVTGPKKMNVKHTLWFLDYLENTEFNVDQQSFFKLIKYSSDIESDKPKKLKIAEVCDLMKKVDQLEK